MRFFSIFLLLFSLLSGESIDEILKVIAVKSDLSEKTKLQNGGISFVFTRSDIERMQVHTLKDVLETIPTIEYKESSYGFPDIFTYGDNKAFISNSIRVFIDNQEIATGMYGSGFMLLGDIDLGFVDHIEIYLNNPSYEYTSEPTLILIKLYTKTAKKDNGGKISFGYDIYNSKKGNVYYANQLKNRWNYFSYFSYDEKNRKKYQIKTTKVSRDHTNFQALSSFYNENNRFLMEVIKSNRDSFLDTSIDLTPQKAIVDSDFVHLGYDGNYNNFYLLLDFDYKLTKSDFKDDVTPKEEYDYLYPIASQRSKIFSNLYNLELKYKLKTEKNTLITGAKYRYKTFKYIYLYRNGKALPSTGNTMQGVPSLFVENQYSLKSNSILNIGVMLAKTINNNSPQQDDILNYRIGHTYTTKNWTFKSVLGQTQFSIDPYLVNSKGFFLKYDVVKKTSEHTLSENIFYQKENNKYVCLLSYSIFKNLLVPDLNDRYLLYNSSKNVENYEMYVSWTNYYDEIDKIFTSLEHQFYNLPFTNNFQKTKFVVRNLKTITKYDIFNELILIHTNDKNGNYIIYNTGVKYHYSKDCLISIKGENLFNKSYKQSYFSADKDSLEQTNPAQISTIDRNIIISVEYYF